jgi:hypothetical protein
MGYNSSLCNFKLFLVICDFKLFLIKNFNFIIIWGFNAFYVICKLLCVSSIILFRAFCVRNCWARFLFHCKQVTILNHPKFGLVLIYVKGRLDFVFWIGLIVLCFAHGLVCSGTLFDGL